MAVLVAMSLLKAGKFLKTEIKIKKDKDLVMFVLPKWSKAQDRSCIVSVPTGWAGAVLSGTLPKRCTGTAHGLTHSC